MERNSNRWQIEHTCPQCSAPVLLEDTDRIFNCPFCRVKLFISTDSYFRYFIPPRIPPSEEMILVPYWRLRGMLFTIKLKQTDSRYVDATLQGYNSKIYPLSLGVRPQAVKLKYLLPEMSHHFYLPVTPFKSIVPNIEKRVFHLDSARFSKNTPAIELIPDLVFSHIFIGESSALIYLPVGFLDGKMTDLVAETALESGEAAEGMNFTQYQHWRLTFTPLLCPECGWDIQADRKTLLLACRNCNSLWTGEGNKLLKHDYYILPGKTGDVYLPFWMVTAEIGGTELTSYADLVRFANLPRVVKPGWEERPLFFWIPGFKIQPKVFLNTIRKSTISQPQTERGDRLPEGEILPLTISSNDLKDSIRLFLMDTAIPRKRFLPHAEDVKVRITSKEIVLVPFREDHGEYLQREMHITLGKNLLRFGENL